MPPDKRLLNQRKREEQEAESIRKEHYGIASRSPDPPRWLRGEKMPGVPGIPMVMLSDVHYGETVSRSETAGMNSYNVRVAEKRLQRFAEVVIDLCSNHMGRLKAKYPGIVLMLGGDMVSGSIHEELAMTEDRTIIEQVLDLEGHLINVIKLLKKEFGRVFIPCVVGNHGRSTHKPRYKQRVHTSFDWMLYCHLDRYFQGDDGIQFLVPNESDAHFAVYGHRYLFTHGDSLGVQGGDGIIGSIGPIVRGAIKVGRSEALIGRDFDCICMGHWHQRLPIPGIHVNGAVIGYNEYARLRLRARYERPTQSLWFNHPAQGVTCHWPVYLEDIPKSEQTTAVVSWKEQP